MNYVIKIEKEKFVVREGDIVIKIFILLEYYNLIFKFLESNCKCI